jgi:outer membrane protein OmpA-like peptidoglycan-associated protein
MKNRLHILFLFVLFLFFKAGTISCQNLVVNGSFEEKQGCPVDYNQIQLIHIASWKQLGNGTPDYFNACSQAVGVPNNVFGSELASTGEAYAGLVTFTNGKKNYREYLCSKLSRALLAGELICVEVNISSADLCSYYSDGFGVLLSESEPRQIGQECIDVPATIENPRLFLMDQVDGWVKMGNIYKAKGGEKFITLGNFKKDAQTNVLHRTAPGRSMGEYSYLYIDDVVVKPVKSKAECSCENEILQSLVVDPPLQLSQYDEIRLDDILFDFDKSFLIDSAKKELDEVYSLLKRNRTMYLEVQGHTDNKGQDGYNVELSKKRAASVVNYLMKKGIESTRLQVKYFGSTKPVEPNESEKGRAKNRRVEFRVLQKRFELVKSN